MIEWKWMPNIMRKSGGKNLDKIADTVELLLMKHTCTVQKNVKREIVPGILIEKYEEKEEEKIICNLWNRMNVKCKNCGKDFELFNSEFCSIECNRRDYLNMW